MIELAFGLVITGTWRRASVLRKKLRSIPVAWNFATPTLSHCVLGDFDEQKRMLRGSIAAACREGLQENHQQPEEKRARVTMVPVKMHVKTDVKTDRHI